MHMGYNDDRRFPDFTFVSGDEPLTDYLDAVIISHFHLDHCGALPFMTEMVGYNGPIYMTGKQCIRPRYSCNKITKTQVQISRQN